MYFILRVLKYILQLLYIPEYEIIYVCITGILTRVAQVSGSTSTSKISSRFIKIGLLKRPIVDIT